MLLLSGFEAPDPPAPSQQELLALVREMRIAQMRAARASKNSKSGWFDEARRLQAAVDRELGILSTEV